MRFSNTQGRTVSGITMVVYMRTAASQAIRRLLPGPAAATQIMSRRGRRRREKSTGTGFAYPNRNGARRKSCAASCSAGRMMVPKGSMWRAGLKLSLPARCAVSSPSIHAAQACAASCSVIAVTTGSVQTEAAYTSARRSKSSSMCSNPVDRACPSQGTAPPRQPRPSGGRRDCRAFPARAMSTARRAIPSAARLRFRPPAGPRRYFRRRASSPRLRPDRCRPPPRAAFLPRCPPTGPRRPPTGPSGRMTAAR